MAKALMCSHGKRIGACSQCYQDELKEKGRTTGHHGLISCIIGVTYVLRQWHLCHHCQGCVVPVSE